MTPQKQDEKQTIDLGTQEEVYFGMQELTQNNGPDQHKTTSLESGKFAQKDSEDIHDK